MPASSGRDRTSPSTDSKTAMLSRDLFVALFRLANIDGTHRYCSFKKYPAHIASGGAMNNAMDRIINGLRTAQRTGMSAEFMQETCPGGKHNPTLTEGETVEVQPCQFVQACRW